MHLDAVDWAIIAGYLIFSLLIGLYFTRRAGKNISEFFLSGRNLPWWLAGTSMVATTFAADTPLAVTEIVAKNGISGNWVWWSFLFGGILTTFFFARLWRRAGVMTDLELIQIRYSGSSASFLRGFRALYLGLFINPIIIGWVNAALISILQVFLDLDKQTALWLTGGCMLLTAAYSAMSGMWGVAVTDAVQFVIAMAGCIVLAFLVVGSEKIGGISGLRAKIPEASLMLFPQIGDPATAGKSLALSLASFLSFAGVMWWACWYPGAEPGGGGYVAQRMLSCKDEKHSIYATLFFQIMHYCARPWPWILVGLATLVLYPGLSEPKLGYVYAMRDFLPSGLRGVLVLAFLAAYMSTISTQLNWGTSYLINDLYKKFNPDLSPDDRKLVHVSRIATVVTMIVSFFVTMKIDSISDTWVFIMECGAGLGLVLILRWYWWRINAWSEIAATIAPFAAYSYCYLTKIPSPTSLFLTVGFTTVTWILVTFLTSSTDGAVLKAFYEKVKPDGAWGPVREALGIPVDSSRIPLLLVCWISAVVMVYSMLFLIGKVIFMEWDAAGICAGALVASFIVLRLASSRVRVFAD